MYHLLIINGWSANARFWNEFIEDLPAGVNSQVIDLDSSKSLEDYLVLIDQNVRENTLLLGWSLGGMLATKYAATSPKKFLGVVTLQATPCFIEKPDWVHGLSHLDFSALNDTVAEQNFSVLVRSFSNLLVSGAKRHKEDRRKLKPVYAEQYIFSGSVLLSGLDLLRELDLRADLPKIKVPFLHVFGGQDSLVSLRQVNQIRELAPTHEFCVIEDMAHFPCGVYRQQIIKRLKSFVNFL